VRVMMVMMMNVVMMMVMMMRWLGHRSGSGRRSVLRHGIAGEAERENRRGGKGLDHGRVSCGWGTQTGYTHPIEASA
jgi:hypothetical protein